MHNAIDLYKYFGIERRGAKGGFLTVYGKERPERGPALLVIPGGGYDFVADIEGKPIADRYAEEGYSSFVLDYSVHTEYPAPLYEAMLAVAYIRADSDKYNIDPEHVTAIGFSAGGHLAGLLATSAQDEANAIGKRIEEVKPNTVILSYPVITTGKFTHGATREHITGGNEDLYEKLSVENRVDANATPAFIWHTYEDECVPVENSMLLAAAYRRHGVPFALHIFEHGRHGMSLATQELCDFSREQRFLTSVGKWVDLSLDWIASRQLSNKE